MWVPRDVIMTSASDVWVQSVCATDRWVRSMVNVDRSTVNTGRVHTGPGQGSGWAGLGRTELDTWHAVVLPRFVHGLLLGCGPRLVVYGGPRDAGPWTADWSTVDRVHHSFLGHGLRAPGSCAGDRRGGCSPISPTAMLLPVASLLVSLHGGASAQLTWVEAPPSLGVFIGGVTTACGVPWCAGHGGSLPGTMTALVRWLRSR